MRHVELQPDEYRATPVAPVVPVKEPIISPGGWWRLIGIIGSIIIYNYIYGAIEAFTYIMGWRH